jgi:hypothetical protein
MAVFYKRSTDIYISKNPNGTASSANTNKINVKNFSYNQTNRIQEVSRSTINPTEERTISPHVAAVAPVNFSFTTYILPLVDTNVTSPEEYLWISLLGADSLTSNSTSSTIDFADGNVAELHNLTLWFNQPNQSEGNYRLDNAIVDSATISFGITNIAEVTWVGRALSMSEDNSPASSTDRTNQTNYLKNRLSTITVDVAAIAYTLALTGGSITINNNNKFYGRSKLGKTTVPVGSTTGKRKISGNLDFYMKSGTNESVDLFNVLSTSVSNDDYESTHLADIIINVGGPTAPKMQINVPQALFSIPQQNFGEVISLSVPFIAKEESGQYSTIVYNMP